MGKYVICSFSLAIFCILVVCCSATSQVGPAPDSVYKLIYGKWQTEGIGRGYVQYYEDSTYNLFSIGELVSPMMGVAGLDSIANYGHGEMSFKLEYVNDTLIRYSFPTDNPEKIRKSYILSLTDDELISMNYKRKQPYTSHISGVGRRFRYTGGVRFPSHECADSLVNSKFVLPEPFQGYVVIAYDQVHGTYAMRGSNNVKIFNVPNSGLLETKESIDLLSYARKRHAFYDHQGNKIPFVSTGVVNEVVCSSEIGKEYLKALDKNGLFALSIGINRFARNLHNEKFGREVVGNVEVYYIGVLGSLIGRGLPKFVKSDNH